MATNPPAAARSFLDLTGISAADLRGNGRWVKLPERLARQHPLHKLGGMPVLLAVLLVVVAGRIAFEAVDVLEVIGWSRAGSVAVTLVLAIAGPLIVGAILSAVLLLLRSPAFQWVCVAFLVLALLSEVLAFGTVAVADQISGVIRTAITVAWLVYVLVSRQINVLTRHRVRRDDPFLADPGIAALLRDAR